MSGEATIRVLLVDDHAVVRGGLVYALSTVPDIEVVGEAGDGERAIAMCAQLQPDVVLMDLVMPRLDGIEATRRLRSHFPSTQVVVLTGFAEKELIRQALQAGAIAYLLKCASYQELVEAIRAAHAGKATLASEVIPLLIQSAMPPASSQFEALSPREREVLGYLKDGLTNLEIANKMVVSVNTIRFHVRSILGKLGVSKRVDVVKRTIHHLAHQQSNTLQLRL